MYLAWPYKERQAERKRTRNVQNGLHGYNDHLKLEIKEFTDISQA